MEIRMNERGHATLFIILRMEFLQRYKRETISFRLTTPRRIADKIKKFDRKLEKNRNASKKIGDV